MYKTIQPISLTIKRVKKSEIYGNKSVVWNLNECRNNLEAKEEFIREKSAGTSKLLLALQEIEDDNCTKEK